MTLRQVTLSARRDESTDPMVTFRDVTAPDDAAAVAMALRLVGGGEENWIVVFVHEIRNAGRPACDRMIRAAKNAQPIPDLFGCANAIR